jgi:serine/threonine protein kinase
VPPFAIILFQVPLEPGSRIDAYEVVRLLGVGGMGEVWLATELRLERRVALKVLPAEVTGDPARVRRFQQEARAASALSHPHVCTIHALGETPDGQHYIVMELVEGQTLRERLRTARLTIRDALDIAAQVASALTAAHSAGIVHRDIKPENVMLRPDGFVKVLDFGLAKLTPVGPALAGADTTRTEVRTDAGTVVGTVAYMSPEQARGQEVDARTDVWALGCVLYEMVAGRSPFSAQSSSDVLAGILDRDPAPLSRFDPDVPTELQRIVGRSLRKDKESRYQSIKDLLLDLQALKEEAVYRRSGHVDVVAPTPLPTPTPSGSRTPSHLSAESLLTQASRHKLLSAAIGLSVVGALAATAWWAAFGRQAAPQLVGSIEPTVTRLTANPEGLPVTSARISPDGRYLAYADSTGVQVRLIATGETQRIADTQRMNVYAWSGDSTKVRASACESGICVGWDISLLGGARRRSGATWPVDEYVIASSDGSRLLRRTKSGETLIDLLDGTPPRVVAHHSSAGVVRAANWSADNNRVFFVRQDGSALDMVSTQGGSPVTVFTAEKGLEIQDVAELTADRLILVMLRRTTAVEFDSEMSLQQLKLNTNVTGVAAGPPHRLTDWRHEQLEHVSASTDGTRLAYVTMVNQLDVYVADLDPLGALAGAPRRLTLDDRDDIPSAWTPDNTTVLFYSTRNGTSDIFKQRLDSDVAEPVVVDTEHQGFPQVTSDGRWVLYVDLRDPRTVRVMRVPLSGGTATLLFTTPLGGVRCAPRGRCVIIERQGSVRDSQTSPGLGSSVRVSALDPISGKGAELAKAPANDTDSLLPDGDAYAFVSPDERGRRNRIRVIPFTGKPPWDIIVRKASSLQSLDWLATGLGVFSVAATSSNNEVLFITPDGSSRVVWSPAGLTPVWAIPSPNGKHLAILVAAQQQNAWMLTNF